MLSIWSSPTGESERGGNGLPLPQEHMGDDGNRFYMKTYLLDGSVCYQCLICDSGVMNSIITQKHMNSLHKSLRALPFICDVCQMGFFSFKGMKLHQSTHFHGRQFVCSICEAKFLYKHHLKRHLISVHKLRQCGYCNQCYGLEEVHVCRPHVCWDKIWFCSVCKIKRKVISNLRWQLIAWPLYLQMVPFPWFVIVNVLDLSSLSVPDMEGMPFLHDSTRAHQQLTFQGQHQGGSNIAVFSRASVHQDSTLKCNLCQIQFSSGLLYRSHVNDFHRDAQLLPFSCTLCHKGFVTKAGLIQHVALHDQKKKITCFICDSKYTYRSSLRKHYESAHNMKECHYCKSVFRNGVEFNQHIVSCDSKWSWSIWHWFQPAYIIII